MPLPAAKAVPVDTAQYPSMVYHLGRTSTQDPITKRFTSLFAGFVVEIGKNEEFDEAAEAANQPKITLQHPRPGKEATQVEYWNFGSILNVFPMFTWVAARRVAGLKRTAEEMATYGPVFYWTISKDEHGNPRKNDRGEDKGESHLEFLAAVQVGNTVQLVQLVGKGLNSEHLLGAMVRHLDAVHALNALRDKSKRETAFSSVEVILPLTVSEKPASFGPNQVYPVAYGGPDTVTLDWAKTAIAGKALLPILEGYWEIAAQWAPQRLATKLAYAGKAGGEYTEEPAPTTGQAPANNETFEDEPF